MSWLWQWPCRWKGCRLVATLTYVYCSRCLTVWPLRRLDEDAHR